MIVKISKSGKQLLFLDDFGNCYALPSSLVSRLIYGGISVGWLVPTLFPSKVNMSRFPKSKLYIPKGYSFDLFDTSDAVQDSDGLNQKRRKDVLVEVGDVIL